MPQNWAGFRDRNNTEAMEIQAKDPELVALLSGTAGAALRADVWWRIEPSAPSITDREKKKHQEVSELFNQGESRNLTGQMHPMKLNPEAHKRWLAQFEVGKMGMSMCSIIRPVKVKLNGREWQKRLLGQIN